MTYLIFLTYVLDVRLSSLLPCNVWKHELRLRCVLDSSLFGSGLVGSGCEKKFQTILTETVVQ